MQRRDHLAPLGQVGFVNHDFGIGVGHQDGAAHENNRQSAQVSNQFFSFRVFK